MPVFGVYQPLLCRVGIWYSVRNTLKCPMSLGDRFVSVSSGCSSEPPVVPDGPRSESVEGSPFRPPHSSSAVFDEDKPIASSGTYNLDFDSIELVDNFQSLEPGVRSVR